MLSLWVSAKKGVLFCDAGGAQDSSSEGISEWLQQASSWGPTTGYVEVAFLLFFPFFLSYHWQVCSVSHNQPPAVWLCCPARAMLRACLCAVMPVNACMSTLVWRLMGTGICRHSMACNKYNAYIHGAGHVVLGLLTLAAPGG